MKCLFIWRVKIKIDNKVPRAFFKKNCQRNKQLICHGLNVLPNVNDIFIHKLTVAFCLYFLEVEVQSLIEENRQLKEQRICKVCMDCEVSIVFLPCGHLVCCSSCAPALRTCPICRTLIRGTLRTYVP